MAALPAGALSGTGQKSTGTDAQSGGLQPQTAGGYHGKAKRVENTALKKIIERMKTKNLDEDDANKSVAPPLPVTASTCFQKQVLLQRFLSELMNLGNGFPE
jgi:hypothetical protein